MGIFFISSVVFSHFSKRQQNPVFLFFFLKRWDHWGYVRYKTEAEALVAIAELNETSMDGPAGHDGHDGWWGRCSWSFVVDLWLFFFKGAVENWSHLIYQ